MPTENDIFDSLEDLGYEGPMLDEKQFQSAVESGPHSSDFTKLIEWLTLELSMFSNIDDYVRCTTSPEDAVTFLMELSGFLREYGCPYRCLTEGAVESRLESRENKLVLLDFLLTEVQAARVTAVNKPQLSKSLLSGEKSKDGDAAAGQLKDMLVALGIPKPPDDISPSVLFERLEDKIKDLLDKARPQHIGKPLLKSTLTPENWRDVEYIAEALRQDYERRRQMTLQRLDVTVESFRWSDKLKSKSEEMAILYTPIRRQMTTTVQTDIAHLLAARESLLEIEKASSGSARERTKCDINRVVIGAVPDRGGRAYELGPPPPDMPSFQRRQASNQHAPGQQRDGGWPRGGKRRGGGGNNQFWQQSQRGRYH